MHKLPLDRYAARVSFRLAWLAAAMVAGAIATFIHGTILGLGQGTVARAFAALIDGALLAPLLHVVLRNHGMAMPARRWVPVLMGALLLCSLFPLRGWPDATFAAVAGKGLIDGLIIGGATAWSLRVRGFLRTLWLLSNVTGAFGVALWRNSAYSLSFPRLTLEQDYPSLLIGAASGLFFAATTALILPWLRGAPAEGADPPATWK
jgi:hypothetical protein